MTNTVRLSLAAALAAIVVACSGAASTDQQGSAQTKGTSQTSGSTGGTTTNTGSTAQVTASTDAGPDVDAAADTAAMQCFTSCIAADPKAKALDDEYMACSDKCDVMQDETAAKKCYSDCDATQETECQKAENQTACALANSCDTKCFGN